MPTALLIVDVQNDFLPPSGSLAVPDGLDILPHIHKFLQDPEWTAHWDLVVATQDWHPRGHISFASAHEGGRPYTKIQVSKRTTDPGFTGDGADADAGGEMIDMFIWPDHCIPGTRGSEIEQGVRERLQPWLTQGKLAIARKGNHMYREAFSAFQGTVVTNVRDPLAPTDEVKVVGPDLGKFLVEKGIKQCVVVGLATDYCVCQTTLSSLAYEVDGKRAFKTFVYTPACRGVSAGDSDKALAEMRGKGAVLVDDEAGLKKALQG